MTLPIHTTAGNHAAPKAKRGLEIYPTPACAVEALARVEPLPHGVWEACGDDASAIATILRATGRRVVPKVVVLERIQFLESDTRAALFDAGKLARIWVFRKRLPRMHRADWTGKRASAAMVLAWFVFDRDHDGPPALDWIRA